MATSIEYGVPSRAVPCRNAVGGRLADLAVHRAPRSSIALATPLATRPVRPDSDMYTMSGFGCSSGADTVGLVVSIVTARAEVHRRRGRGEENAETTDPNLAGICTPIGSP